MKIVSIVLVDDHRVVTRSLKAYLESFPDLRVVAIAGSGEELLHSLDEWNPDIILQDLMLPGGMDGIETIRRTRQRAPAVKIIALTASTDEARLIGALRAGAEGYVRKDADPETLLSAVRAVARGRTFVDPAVSLSVIGSARDCEEMTSRELEVLRILAAGHANKEVASRLGITEETVKTHVGHILAKLEAGNRAQAIVLALKRGLISLDDAG